jgi:hypothetical protein
MVNLSERQNLLTSQPKINLWLIFLVILGCYALLTIPALDRMGIGWDEAADLRIAQTYMTPQGLLLGSSYDPSQTRLPMFMGSLLFRLFGTTNLLLARLTTIFVGGLTLLGIFVYGKKYFTPTTGLVAAGLLAINPFFLSFARMAFTESDVYLACTLTWFMVILSRFQDRPSWGWAVLSGIFLGLTISSKATAFMFVPGACAAFLVSQIYFSKLAATPQSNISNRVKSRYVWLWFAWTIFAALAGLLISRQVDAGIYPRRFHLINYGLICLAWLIVLIGAWRNRNSTTHPLALAALMAGTGILTFVIFPPEHLGNSNIIGALISRTDEEWTFHPSFTLELAAFHTFVIFFKSTPILGFGLLAGFAFSFAQWRRREMILPIVLGASYLLTLLILPLAQTFYTIPLLPIVSLLAADQLLRLQSQQKMISHALTILGLIWWSVEVQLCYPDYHLNGYQWLGARPFFGRSSIGYRSIVYVPSDGVQQSVEWLNENAKAGEIAHLYGAPHHIVEMTSPDPDYQLKDGIQGNLNQKPDYVLIHLESIIWQGRGNDTPGENIFRYPFDIRVLQREYQQVFSVQRAFDLEVASIWKRR